MTRRQVIRTGVGAAMALRAQNSVSVKALVFDVFGTVVDWRGSIIEEGKASGIRIDWARFADEWRDGYVPSMAKVRKGELPWTNLDHLNRALLEDLLENSTSRGFPKKRKITGTASGTA